MPFKDIEKKREYDRNRMRKLRKREQKHTLQQPKQPMTEPEQTEYEKYLEFKQKHYPYYIPHRPNKDEKVLDQIRKEILNQQEWDKLYGKWREYIEGRH